MTERHVEPYRLVHAARRWYLVARDRDREAWRTFRVDRIDDPVRTGWRFGHTDLPDAAALVAEGLAVGAYRHRARVLLRLPLEEAARLVPPTVGILEPAGADTLLRIGADDPEWIARYLAGLPCRFRVLEPEGLREALGALARRLTEDEEARPDRRVPGRLPSVPPPVTGRAVDRRPFLPRLERHLPQGALCFRDEPRGRRGRRPPGRRGRARWRPAPAHGAAPARPQPGPHRARRRPL